MGQDYGEAWIGAREYTRKVVIIRQFFRSIDLELNLRKAPELLLSVDITSGDYEEVQLREVALSRQRGLRQLIQPQPLQPMKPTTALTPNPSFLPKITPSRRRNRRHVSLCFGVVGLREGWGLLWVAAGAVVGHEEAVALDVDLPTQILVGLIKFSA